jgi:CO dehydrogenase/acetyl-CoA synthase epsilon subunit
VIPVFRKAKMISVSLMVVGGCATHVADANVDSSHNQISEAGKIRSVATAISSKYVSTSHGSVPQALIVPI